MRESFTLLGKSFALKLLGAAMWELLVLMLLSPVHAQPGFLSLSCGAKRNVSVDGVLYVPDDEYISTGYSARVARTNFAYNSHGPYETLRYFPEVSRKHCYSLPVTSNQKYLVRLVFNYGNYDGLDRVPNIDVQVGTATTNVRVPGVASVEFILRVTTTVLYACVGSTSSKDIPFISFLVLRLLGPSMYPTSFPNQALLLRNNNRVNLGAANASDSISYPQDQYDRLWYPDVYALDTTTISSPYPVISTESVVSPGTTRDQPPSYVMQTAKTSNTSISYTFPESTVEGVYYIAFYFAELDDIGDKSRIFNIYTNSTSGSKLYFGPVKLNESKRAYEMLSNQESLDGPTTFLFVPTAESTLGPILNAAEIYTVQDMRPGTHPSDVTAITSVKASFNLVEWAGDPCFPDAYAWDWLKCTGNEQGLFRITTLSMSNMHLNGSIPPDFTNLTELTAIYLDNNNLQGHLPDLGSLKKLTTLHVQKNYLTGRVPPSFFQMPALKEMLLQENSLDVCGFSQKPDFVFNISGNPSCSSNNSASRTKRKQLIILIPILGMATVAMIAALVFVRSQRLKKIRKKSPDSGTTGFAFTYEEILAATNNNERKLGRGGFGVVYYGRLPNGKEVAVKIPHENSTQGSQEFQNEVQLLSLVHHKNLVTLVGLCNHDSKLILVYEFMCKGTLQDHLKDPDFSCLSWSQRLNIALGAARGLEYLHTACMPRIIHRDVKSSNILLDESLTAKVADFGLSVSCVMDATHVTTMPKGTIGYLDPEYHHTMRLTEKSDVYSFGVVLLEIISGRLPIDCTLSEEKVSLVMWATHEVNRGTVEEIVDPRLTSYNKEALWKVAQIAICCVEPSSKDRPTMSMVVDKLKEATQLDNSSADYTSELSFSSNGAIQASSVDASLLTCR